MYVFCSQMHFSKWFNENMEVGSSSLQLLLKSELRGWAIRMAIPLRTMTMGTVEMIQL
jgi:hypothetical protein